MGQVGEGKQARRAFQIGTFSEIKGNVSQVQTRLELFDSESVADQANDSRFIFVDFWKSAYVLVDKDVVVKIVICGGDLADDTF